ncbi:hypothetical protein VYU27_000589 [Nannochloropsis oceanica]
MGTPDLKALTMDFTMIGAFVLAVNGCALYTLQRVIKRIIPRIFWALVILCLPVLGALIFFFIRPRDPMKSLEDDEFEEPEFEIVSPRICTLGDKTSSPTTPCIIRNLSIPPLKTPEGAFSSSANFMYAPSS